MRKRESRKRREIGSVEERRRGKERERHGKVRRNRDIPLLSPDCKRRGREMGVGRNTALSLFPLGCIRDTGEREIERGKREGRTLPFFFPLDCNRELRMLPAVQGTMPLGEEGRLGGFRGSREARRGRFRARRPVPNMNDRGPRRLPSEVGGGKRGRRDSERGEPGQHTALPAVLLVQLLMFILSFP